MKLGIVILTHKNVADTVECINSLKKIKSKYVTESQIFLVDNSDTKFFLNEILKLVDGINSFYLEENGGYASGNNVGIQKAIEADCEFILVINNDTIVQEYFIDPLLREYDDQTGIVAPKILRYHDNAIWSSGGEYRALLCNFIMTRDEISEVKVSNFINGCCFLASRNIFQRAGLIPDNYFMYGEDADFCIKLQRLGYINKIVPNSIIYHKVSKSSGPGSLFQTYYIYRNRLLLIKLNFDGMYQKFAYFSNIVQCVMRAGQFLIQRRFDYFNIMLHAIRDGHKEGKSKSLFL